MSQVDNEFDFGFSFEDEEIVSVTPAPAPTANNDQIALLQSKIDSLLDAQEKTLQAAHSEALEAKYKAKLKEVEGLILPLLYNLMKNPDKPMIKWANREPVIKKQIERILAVTRGEDA
jgi:hypothetical protein